MFFDCMFFKVYGLSENVLRVTVVLKVVLATMLLTAVILPSYNYLAFYGSFVEGSMMAVAVFVHIRIKSDPIFRAFPALVLMFISAFVVFHTEPNFCHLDVLLVILISAVLILFVYMYLSPGKLRGHERQTSASSESQSTEYRKM